MKLLLFLLTASFVFSGCGNSNDKKIAGNESSFACSDECNSMSKSKIMSCKLTTPELQNRKATVLASLKSKIIETKELKDGYAFKFPGNDEILDELTEFIKTERACCDFFTFGLSVSGDKSETWLQITGEEGAKGFITTELGL